MQGCQFIGADQDPLRDYPIKFCGAKVIDGKNYCHDHYWRVYKKGTAIAGKKVEKAIEAEIEELKKQQEIDEDEAYESV